MSRVKKRRTVAIAKGPAVGEEIIGGGGIHKRDSVGLFADGEVGRAAVAGRRRTSARGPIQHSAIVLRIASVAIRDPIAATHRVENEGANGIEVNGSGVYTISRKEQREVVYTKACAIGRKPTAAIHFAAQEGDAARVERRSDRRNRENNREEI